ncbi:helix-turn-helix domain-containing protein [Rhizohabitans arisaemae]|uniref:helix-turn-helix domain-containing protein n=1 Tax=Rhizohabitans arisaemae TaxID=2720610 RepID=UPI0024B25748|nr:helix-turn-helix domain-containing protein [Rhizohabitans arisaemae]
MNSVRELAEEACRQDPATGLATVAALRRLLEELEELHVGNARAQGWSWEAVAEALGVTKQTTHRKHARRLAEGRR